MAGPNVTPKKDHRLRPAEEIYHELRADPKLVTVTAEEAAEIYRVFRGQKISPAAVQDFQYRAFLQAAMMSAVDASKAMSWIEALFRGAYKPNATVIGVLKKLAAHALREMYREWKGEPQPLYRSVIDTIAWSHQTYFQAIENGIDL